MLFFSKIQSSINLSIFFVTATASLLASKLLFYLDFICRAYMPQKPMNLRKIKQNLGVAPDF